MNFLALFATLVVGLFMLVGSAIVFITKNNKNIINFSIGMAFSIMVFLLGLELIPESLEHLGFEDNKLIGIILFALFAFIGGYALKYLDKFIPHHHDDHCHDEHKEEHHLYHIGIMTLIAVVLHNIIEGMAIYGVFDNGLEAGLLLSVGIILHNIPLGMAITATLYKANNNIKKTLLLVSTMALASLLGGLLMYPISLTEIGEIAIGILLSITSGMIFYILIFEFLHVVIDNKKDKFMRLGLLVGSLISFIGIGSH
jgi:zinc transporter, ZIP family